MTPRPHPAAFPEKILEILRTVVPPGPVLDPFGGVGRLGLLGKEWQVSIVEIEPEWALQAVGNGCLQVLVGDSRFLTRHFALGSFPCICTSPTYGNRLADHDASQLRVASGQNLKASDGTRNSYTAKLGRKLSEGNSGEMYFANKGPAAHSPARGRDPRRTGDAYKDLHRQVWIECWQVLQPGGLLILNSKDQPGHDSVCAWHKETLAGLGFVRERELHVPVKGDRNTVRMRKRGLATVDYEEIGVWRKLYGPQR